MAAARNLEHRARQPSRLQVVRLLRQVALPPDALPLLDGRLGTLQGLYADACLGDGLQRRPRRGEHR